jgi:hypothetical protein
MEMFSTRSVDLLRRRLIGAAAMATATLPLAALVASKTQASNAAPSDSKPQSESSFSSPKQIRAGLLDISYVDAGPSDGPPILLLHGWPYDIHSFEEVAPLLASKGGFVANF